MPLGEKFLRNLKIETVLKKNTQLPERTSPLFTNFDRWAGKKKRLYFKDIDALKVLGDNNFNLGNNPFAKILSSPVRLDRISNIKLPQQLLIQVKTDLAKIPNIELSTGFTKNTVDKNSYILNKMSVIEKRVKNIKTVLPLHLLTFINPKDKTIRTELTIEQHLAGYVNELKEIILKYLINIPKEDIRDQSDSCSYVELKYDPADTSITDLQIFKNDNNNYNYIIKLNLALVKDLKWEESFAKRPSNIRLHLDRDMDMILHIYRLITFLS